MTVKVRVGGDLDLVGVRLNSLNFEPGSRSQRCRVGNDRRAARTHEHVLTQLERQALPTAHRNRYKGCVDTRALNLASRYRHHCVTDQTVHIPHTVHDLAALFGNINDERLAVNLNAFVVAEHFERTAVPIGVNIVVQHGHAHFAALFIDLGLRYQIVSGQRCPQRSVLVDMHGEQTRVLAATTIAHIVGRHNRAFVMWRGDGNEVIPNGHLVALPVRHLQTIGFNRERITVGVGVVREHVNGHRSIWTNTNGVRGGTRDLVQRARWRHADPHARRGLFTKSVLDDVAKGVGTRGILGGRVFQPSRSGINHTLRGGALHTHKRDRVTIRIDSSQRDRDAGLLSRDRIRFDVFRLRGTIGALCRIHDFDRDRRGCEITGIIFDVVAESVGAWLLIGTEPDLVTGYERGAGRFRDRVLKIRLHAHRQTVDRSVVLEDRDTANITSSHAQPVWFRLRWFRNIRLGRGHHQDFCLGGLFSVRDGVPDLDRFIEVLSGGHPKKVVVDQRYLYGQVWWNIHRLHHQHRPTGVKVVVEHCRQRGTTAGQ